MPTSTRRSASTFFLLLLLAVASATQAAEAGRHSSPGYSGVVVALAPDYLVVDTADHGRRLFLLSPSIDLPASLRAGDEVAVGFTVGTDAQLHASSLARRERRAVVPNPPAERPRWQQAGLVALMTLLAPAAPVWSLHGGLSLPGGTLALPSVGVGG